MIRYAADGSDKHRALFSRRYLPLVRAYFEKRWRGSQIAQEVSDAVQDVFLECCRDGGVLAKAGPERGKFRSYLLASARNVARRYEERAGRRHERTAAETAFLRNLPSQEDRLSVYFDRRWAQKMMAEAADLMKRRAAGGDEKAQFRYDILQLRFQDGQPIREIAARCNVPPREAHDAFAKARREFHRCLREVVALHGTASEAELDDECRELLALLKRS